MIQSLLLRELSDLYKGSRGSYEYGFSKKYSDTKVQGVFGFRA